MCTIVLHDLLVSRQHAAIERRESDQVFVDLESSNGSMINGQLVRAPVRLRPGT
jgi:pSer/pThr/pTyr-binding forkhead associated (FHA) protein